MTTPTLRAASQASSNGAATVTLPVAAGVVDGDWGVVTVAAGSGVTMTLPAGWTAISGPAIFGPTGSATQYVVMAKKYATGDPADVIVSLSAAPKWSAVGSWWRDTDGPDTAGAVSIRSTSVTTSTASAVGTDGQVVLVAFGEKSSTSTTISVSPTTTLDGSAFPTGTGEASAYMGHYTVVGSPADRTATYDFASSNGFGIQVPLLDGTSVPPPPPPPATTATFKVYVSGAWHAVPAKCYSYVNGSWQAATPRAYVNGSWGDGTSGGGSTARSYVGSAATGGGVNVGIPSFASSMSIPAGSLVVVGVVGNGTTMTGTTVTDSVGNTYTEVAPSAVSPSPVALTTLLYSKTTVDINVGDAWTLTMPVGSRGKAAWVVDVFDGVLAAPQDSSATAVGKAATISSGATGTLAQADELVIGVVGVGATDLPTFTNGYAQGSSTVTTSGTNDRRVALGYQFVSATSPATVTANLPTTQSWAISAATFKTVATTEPPSPTFKTMAGISFGGNGDPSPVESMSNGHKFGVHRSYWQANQQTQARDYCLTDKANGRIPWLSFKLPSSWADVAAGNQDAWANALLDLLDAVGTEVWVAFHHEPENDAPISDWVAMNQRLLPMVKSRANLKATIILTGYPEFVSPITFPMTTVWPGDGLVDIAGFDPYNMYGAYQSTYGVGAPLTSWVDMDSVYFAPMQAWANAHGCKWAIAETGITDPAFSNPPTGKDGAGWMMDAYLKAQARGAVAWCYFDSFLNSRGYWPTDQIAAKRQALANVLNASKE